MDKKYVCCFCGKVNEDWGNNPAGAAWLNEEGEIEMFEPSPEDRCCNECNMKYVIPGRLYRLKNNK